MLILLIVLVLLFGGGRWVLRPHSLGSGRGSWCRLGTVLLIALIVYLLGGLR